MMSSRKKVVATLAIGSGGAMAATQLFPQVALLWWAFAVTQVLVALLIALKPHVS